MGQLLSKIYTAILKVLGRTTPTPQYLVPPSSTKEIDITRLRNLLQARFPDAQIFLSDRKYKLCNIDDIYRFIGQDKTNKMEFEDDWLDCDDFTYRLLGQFSIPGWASLAFGMCWTDKHALNVLVTEEREVKFLEPQTDEIKDKLETEWGTKYRMVII